jgi:hypothetical protein
MGFRTGSFVLTLLMAFVIAACNQGNDFKASLADFQTSTETATAAIKTYYTELNQYERDLYLQERLLNDSLRVAIKDRQGNPTPLLFQPFVPEAIQGRIDLLQQIAVYGQLLATLAGNEAPDKTKKNLMSLSEDLSKLNTRFEALSKQTDLAAGKYLGPVTVLVGIVSKPLLEKKRAEAVRQAIRDGQAPIDSILTFLEQDLSKYVETTRNTGQRLEMAEWVNYYNRHLGKLDFEKRQLLLGHINRAAIELDLVKQSKPADVVTELKKAHAALVQYAASGGKPTALGSLVSAVNAFQEEARQLVETVVALQKLTRKG